VNVCGTMNSALWAPKVSPPNLCGGNISSLDLVKMVLSVSAVSDITLRNFD